jgi:CBS domain-containing protein
MKVKDLMSKSVEMISSSSNLVDAAEKMRSMEMGALPVSEGEELIGMVTDRDIVIRAIAQDKDPCETFISEVMTPEIYYCFEGDDIAEAAKQMEERTVRRLLVFNSDYEPKGFISLADFALKSRDEHLTCELLGCVCEPM